MENKQVDEKNLQEVIGLIDRKPRRSTVIISMNSELADSTGLTFDRHVLPTQYVLAKGDLVKDIEVGDKVELNLSALTVYRRSTTNSDEAIPEINANPIEMGDYLVGQVDERVIESIYIK